MTLAERHPGADHRRHRLFRFHLRLPLPAGLLRPHALWRIHAQEGALCRPALPRSGDAARAGRDVARAFLGHRSEGRRRLSAQLLLSTSSCCCRPGGWSRPTGTSPSSSWSSWRRLCSTVSSSCRRAGARPRLQHPSLVALWVVRPVDNLNPIQCFLYFANFYMFGMLFCEYRKPIMDFVSAARRARLAGRIDPRHRLGAGDGHATSRAISSASLVTAGVSSASTSMLVQKYVGIFLFCGLLTYVAGWMKRPLAFVADHSFGLFFMHGIVIAVLMRMPAAAVAACRRADGRPRHLQQPGHRDQPGDRRGREISDRKIQPLHHRLLRRNYPGWPAAISRRSP